MPSALEVRFVEVLSVAAASSRSVDIVICLFPVISLSRTCFFIPRF